MYAVVSPYYEKFFFQGNQTKWSDVFYFKQRNVIFEHT